MRRALALLAAAVLAGGCASRQPEASSPSPTGAPSPSSTGTPTGTPAPDPAAARVRLVPVATLQEPLGMAVRTGDESLYVAQKTGELVAIRPDGDVRTVLDLSDEVSGGGEQGLLGAAFSPDGGFLYVNYTDLAGDTRVHEFAMRGDAVDPSSRREVLRVDQPYSNHNGGHLAFGPDGYLYIGLGDGGSGGDPEDNAQNLGRLLGKMLRIAPRPADGRPYGIPPDNPFVGRDGARPAIWAYGLRNPWRYSFDRETGDLWIGDVGQDEVEEIDVQAAGSAGGENYGWDGFEGSMRFEEPYPQGAVPPVYEYGRALGGTVIGGFVYRGSAIPALRGAYLFGDLFNPDVRILVPSADGFRHAELGVTVDNLVSFGEDHAGELYLLSLSGPVYRLDPA
jgi:glucose/arabinose dehydrogenase